MAEDLNFRNTTALMQKYGNQVVLEMISNLRSKGKVASGTLEKSLKYKLSVNGEDIEIDIVGEDYWDYVDKGRVPGSFPPITALSVWAKRRGIPETALYPIARKIYKKGIKPSDFATSAIKGAKSKFAEMVQAAYIEDLKEYIKTLKEKIKN